MGDSRPRLVVLTDIGGDPDDLQSLVRLLVHSSEFEIEGLIATASNAPSRKPTHRVNPELIREAVDRYAKVRDRLVRHAERFPRAESLRRVIRSGNPHKGRDRIGEAHDTAGSRHLIVVIDRDDPRPVNVTIWGGQTDLAQALWRVKMDRGPEDLESFVGKLRIYDIADQDGLAGWIRGKFPDLFYILNRAPRGEDRREASFRGMYLGGDLELTSRAWLDAHVRREHGPLGELYPVGTWTAPNPHGALKEGDTPSWFHFLPNGLGDPVHPEWGGWGGRFREIEDGFYRDASDRIGEVEHARATVWRWRPAFQNHFRARMDWCVVESFGDANHAPRVVCQGSSGRSVIPVEVSAGRAVELDAEGSSDPDGDDLVYNWYIYPEAGSFDGAVEIESPGSVRATLSVPAGAAGETIHVILEVTDRGRPPLTSYRRVVMTAR